MITNILIKTFFLITTGIMSILPDVTISSIAIIGEEISTLLTTMVGYWNGFLIIFPYAEIVWQMFLFVILPFEGMFLLAKLILGNRMPTNTN